MSVQTAPRILIVEDDHDFASTLSLLLRNAISADVELAEDYASAEEALASSTFDLVTLAYQLPDANGLQLLEEFMGKSGHPPVVLVTGQGDEDTAASCCQAGAAGYVMKDGRMSFILPAVIKKALEHSSTQRSLRESETRYRRLFEASRDGILILDAVTGDIIDINPYLTELLGYTHAELLGKKLWEIGPFKDKQLAKSTFARLQREGYVRYQNLPLESRYGQEVAVEFVSNAYVEDHNKVIQCNIRNITDRRKLEKRVGESEKQYRGLYESMKEGVLFQDIDGRILNANQAFVDMMGYTLVEIRGLTLEDITPVIWRKRESEILEQQVLARGYSDPYEKECIRKNGTVFPVDLRVWLINDDQGNPAGMWALIRDITERKQAHLLLERVNAELNEFAYAVAHDLRGPISAIEIADETLKTLISLPKDETSDADIRQLTEMIGKHAARLDAITGDLLLLAESGQIPDEVTSVVVLEIVETVLEGYAAAISEKRIKVEVDEDLGYITADATQLYQVFANLIWNAVKHNDSPEPAIRIAYLGEDAGGAHRYLVRDNGSGIPPKILDRVFMPLIKGKSGDCGLGLSTVEKIVKVYNGEIKAYNDNGACFEFFIKDAQSGTTS